MLSVGLAVLAGCEYPSGRPETKQSVAEPLAAPRVDVATEPAQVIAYYFHGTMRCETCLRIEKQAHDLIYSRFAAEMAAARLVFKPVNYDQPENAHFCEEYKLPCPSLVLVRQIGGKNQDWKLLGQTWDLVQIPPKLDQYIEEEIARFLEAAR